MVIASTNVGLVSSIQSEMGDNSAASNVSLSSFYATGTTTPVSGTSVASSGAISMSSFRGARCGPLSFRVAPKKCSGPASWSSTLDSTMPDLTAEWLWSSAWGDSSTRASTCVFQHIYTSASAVSAILYYNVDESLVVTLNGTQVVSTTTTTSIKSGSVTVSLIAGTNVFVLTVKNAAGFAGCRWVLRDSGNTVTLAKSAQDQPAYIRCSPYTPLCYTNFITSGTTTSIGSALYASPTITGANSSNNMIQFSSGANFGTGFALGWPMHNWGPVARMDFYAQFKCTFSGVGGMWLAFGGPTVGYFPAGSQDQNALHFLFQGSSANFFLTNQANAGTYVTAGSTVLQQAALPTDNTFIDVFVTYMWQPTGTWTWNIGGGAITGSRHTSDEMSTSGYLTMGGRASGSVSTNPHYARYVNVNIATYRKFAIVFERNDLNYTAPSTYSFRFARGTATDDADALLDGIRNGSVTYMFMPKSTTPGTDKTHFKVWASTDYASNAGVWTVYTSPVNTALTQTRMSSAVGPIAETVYGYVT